MILKLLRHLQTITLGAAMLAAAHAAAAPDSLVTSYGDDGLVHLGYLGVPPPQLFSNGARESAMTFLPDGSLLVALYSFDGTFPGVVRVDLQGQIDTTFGSGGLATLGGDCGGQAPPPGSSPVDCPLFIGVFPDRVHGGFFTVQDVPPGGQAKVSLARFDARGVRDTAFGIGGFQSLPPLCGQYGCVWDQTTSAMQDALGRVVAGGRACFDDNRGGCAAEAVRFAADGSVDASFGNGGRAMLPWSGYFAGLHPGSGGALIGALAVDSQTSLNAVRLLPNGIPDATFGANGLATVANVANRPSDAIELADRRVLVTGGTEDTPAIWTVACLAPDGSRCASWGSQGLATFSWIFDIDSYTDGPKLLLQPNGKVVATGPLFMQTGARIAIARLDAAGIPDVHFAGNGKSTVWSYYGSVFNDATLDADGHLLIAGEEQQNFHYEIHGAYGSWHLPTLMLFAGGDTSTPRTVAEDVAAEYYDATFDHYFVTALASEISLLNQGDFVGWTPTGQHFKVWTGPSPQLSPVCRFFSGASFAPKSSHFYTPYAAECASLKAGSVWAFEGNVFNLQLATTTPNGLVCPLGTAPLYRLYNNGQGGAPNHRYTDDLATLDAMVAKGWIFEGDAKTKVFACLPGD